MIKLNKEALKDKIHACWIGKNIGGTIGTPYEGRRELLDVKGFSTPGGAPLPNDDLDLQLIWLLAMEEHGPYQLNAQILGEYWISYITPHWNEYGIGKCNMKAGLLPPVSGEYQNHWKHSNGAWIRSEIWACMAPASPDVAIRYALQDACVDHGMAEGTYAEFFTAALESAAFVITDIRKLIDIGLSKIPSDCRVARSVNIVLDAYDKGLDWVTARNLLVEDSTDLGWFQAPANIGFTVLGLLYGEGDFKKSVIYAVNCGDDTDCTGATVGAVLGIMKGMKGIPEDWRSHIGDGIVTISLDNSCWAVAKTCTELTERTFDMVPLVLKANKANVMLHDGDDVVSDEDINKMYSTDIAQKLYSTPGYSYSFDFIYAGARVEFDGEPVIEPSGSINVKVRFFNKMNDAKHLNIQLHLPEGWTASGWRRDVYLRHQEPASALWSATITANEHVEAVNRVIIEASVMGRPSVCLIPITILG
ncbi:MAG TPA: ADP-ribosylglycohydrolase family protein [Clostridiales bacterium]|nr:ADP-ribosylglycohydrolase family protein [Clostridiales bacterium]